MSYNNQTDFTGSTQSDLEMENFPELVSNCCRAYPRLEVNGVEWNDEDYGICPACGNRCEYVEENFYGLDTITYDDGTVELIERGIIQPNIGEEKCQKIA